MIFDEDFSSVVSDYEKFKAGDLKKTSRSFILASEELNGRFNYDFYAPQNRKLITVLKRKKSVKLGEIVEIVKTRSKKLLKSDEIVEYVELADVNMHTSEIINSTNYLVHELPSRATYELRKTTSSHRLREIQSARKNMPPRLLDWNITDVFAQMAFVLCGNFK